MEGRDRVIATSQTFKVMAMMAMVIEMAIVVILLATMLVMLSL